jgi:ATP-binding cassette subfamily G (WHITE) protein 1
MGASGAGKTSLLQLLAGQVHQGHVYGDILVNGEQCDPKKMKKISGFVFQDDVILGTMTVKEAITMSATLRLGKEISDEYKQERVDKLITLLNLEKCKNTIVGDTNIKGISGGERKRYKFISVLIIGQLWQWNSLPTL